ncbi:MAG: tyrosine-protein kinase [Alcanivoracaceae bacterium]|nr:tyrosine-protein kinase [Alcanivoracaceae bacterium]|tara:strand:- start:5679 stop:7889 length:2211 start_codon:yes stop_codon:yes gene_type:complete
MTETRQAQQPHHSTSDDEIDLLKLIAVLKDHLGLIIAITVLAGSLGVAYALLATPIYKADALLQVEEKQSGVPGFEEISEMFAEESSASAEIELIRSRMVLGQVIDRFNMQVMLEPDRLPLIGNLSAPAPLEDPREQPLFAGFRDSETFVTIEHFTVPEEWQGEAFTLRSENGDARLYYEGALVAEGPVSQPISGMQGRLRLVIGQWQLKDEELILVQLNRLAVIENIRKNLFVAERGKDTGIITLSYEGEVRERNRKILDAIAEVYLNQNIQRNAAEAENSLEFLNEQLPELKDKLMSSEETLNQYRLKNESVDLTLETQSTLERLVTVDAQLNELKIKESEISSRFTQSHPAYRTLIRQRQSLQQEKAQIEADIKRLPETQQEVLRMMRDVEVNQQIYVGLLNKVQELRIMKASTVGNVRIIDAAMVPAKPVKPQKALVVMVAIMMGGMLGVGYVLLRSILHRGLHSPEQLEELGIAVYGSVPLSEEQQKQDQKIFKAQKRKSEKKYIPLLARTNPADLAVEALRSLRTRLHFAMMEAGNNVLMISGPSPEVGKSFISANMGEVLASIGQRVIVIDADMRKGHLHRYFENGQSPGLSDWLSGQVEMDAVIHNGGQEKLDFIPRGQIPPNPSELLMHERFGQLIEKLSGEYDLVLVDTPPILAVTDAAIVGQSVGTSLVVARFGRNSAKEVDVAVGRFEQHGIAIKGVILNCMESLASNEYGYYAYGYGPDHTNS